MRAAFVRSAKQDISGLSTGPFTKDVHVGLKTPGWVYTHAWGGEVWVGTFLIAPLYVRFETETPNGLRKNKEGLFLSFLGILQGLL